MSLYYKVYLGENVELPKWEYETDPEEVTFQTKDYKRPTGIDCLEIREDDLYVERKRNTSIPEDFRQKVLEKSIKGEDVNKMDRASGMYYTVYSYMERARYKGALEFSTHMDEERLVYLAIYGEDGLEDIKRL